MSLLVGWIRVKELETAKSEPTGTGQNNDQGIYKDPSRNKLTSFGSAQSVNFTDDLSSGAKKMDITFREPFKTTPVVIAGSSYRSGIPEEQECLIGKQRDAFWGVVLQ